METRLINIAVPINWKIPEILNSLNPEEIGFILTNGCEMIKEARNIVVNLSQKEIYNKVREEANGEIKKLEMDLLVQKSLTENTIEQTRKIYESQINRLQEKLVELTNNLTENLNNNKYKIQQEIDKEKDKYKILMENKEKQVLRITENYEKILQQQVETKSSKKIGDEGEDNFVLLSETFKDFLGYKIEKKSHIAHKGDFHLFFDRFNVLVDLKKYSGIVQKKEIEKIEHDLSMNDTMDFAWLISYDSNVSEWNRFPIMFKWIMTNMGLKCIVIVNKLNAHNNPMEILRMVWNMTYEIYVMLKNTKDNENNELLKQTEERDYAMIQKIKTIHKKSSDMKRNALSMLQISKDIEDDLLDTISLFTNEMSKKNIDKGIKVEEWWNENYVKTDNKDLKLTSTEIWTKYKKENRQFIEDNNLTTDVFRDYLKDIIDGTNYVEKSKRGVIEIVGYKMKELTNIIKDEKMELELDEKKMEKKMKNVIKDAKIKIIVNEECDKSVIKMYENMNNDIIKIAKVNNIHIWQVISILVTNKVIDKRVNARGYDKYVETEEYKNKMIK
jgi:hypothetical protein